MSAPQELKVTIDSAARTRQRDRHGNAVLSVHTDKGTFRTAANSQASIKIDVGIYPKPVRRTLIIGNRGTIVEVQ